MYLWSGSLDTMCKPGVMYKTADYYQHYVPAANIQTVFTVSSFSVDRVWPGLGLFHGPPLLLLRCIALHCVCARVTRTRLSPGHQQSASLPCLCVHVTGAGGALRERGRLRQLRVRFTSRLDLMHWRPLAACLPPLLIWCVA